MDLAKRGSSALDNKDFASAITHYTDALKQLPHAVDYYIKRSTAYTRSSPPDHQKALEDAETAILLAVKRGKRELIGAGQLRRGIALYGLQRYADANEVLIWARKINEKEKMLPLWEAKTANKLKELPEGDEKRKPTVKEIPDGQLPDAEPKKAEQKASQSSETNGTATASAAGVQTPANKIRHEWYQQNDVVTVTLFAKGIPKDKATVEIKARSLSISFPLPAGSDYDLSLDPLFADINPAESTYKIMSTKAEFTLKKAAEGQKWHTLEGTGPASVDEPSGENDEAKRAILTNQKPAGPSYPTSSKSGPKNWDKLATDLTSKKPKKDGGEEDDGYESGGDGADKFFSMLYKDADPDVKRAMMKSYTESNGTALSTNWAEVKKGKVETTPPDGMEAKKWS